MSDKFERLGAFIKKEISEKGAVNVAKEIEDLMHEKGLYGGPLLKDFLVDIDQELVRRFCTNINVHLDYETNRATFMLHGVLSKKLLGYQTYNPNTTLKKTNDVKESRYFTYQRSYRETGEYAIFGLEYLENRDFLFVTEGIFETTRLINLSFDSVAILTSNPPKNLITQLHTLNDNIIWCGDGDTAGKRSSLAKYPHLFFDKDLDEVDENVLLEGIKNITI